jgi:hypothetical protein
MNLVKKQMTYSDITYLNREREGGGLIPLFHRGNFGFEALLLIYIYIYIYISNCCRV